MFARDPLFLAERAEQRAWADLLAADPVAARRVGAHAVSDGGALILSSPGLAHPFFNRAFGAAADPAQLTRIAAHYAAREIDRYLVHAAADAEPAEMARAAASAGLVPFRRTWGKFLRGPEPPPVIATELEVRRAGRADADACAAIAIAAFDLPAAAAPVLAAAVARPRWHVYVACDGAAPVAVGALFVDDEVAVLVFGATDAGHRGRGAQGALMARRILAASALGCRWITTETGLPIADEPNPSYGNMLRCGFRLAARRPNFALEGMTWGEPASR